MIEAIKAIPLTFFSRPFYWDLIRRWQGIGFAFILLITFFDFAHIAIGVALPMAKMFASIPSIFETLPVATIRDHKLSIDQPTPFKIELNKNNVNEKTKVVSPPIDVVIDTNYTATDSTVLKKKMLEERILVLFTATQMYTFKPDTQELRMQDMSSFPDSVMTHDEWVKIGKTLVWALPLFLSFFYIAGSLVGNLVVVFIFSLVALLVGLISKSVPDLGSAMRLSAAAAMPGTLIFIVAPYSLPIKFLIYLGYIIFGAVCARKLPI